MFLGWHKEVTSFLALLWPNVAVSRELVVTIWEFVLWILVDVNFLILLCCLYMISFQEHFHLQSEVLVQIICAYSQEIETVLLIHSILSVEPILILYLKEMVICWVIS